MKKLVAFCAALCCALWTARAEVVIYPVPQGIYYAWHCDDYTVKVRQLAQFAHVRPQRGQGSRMFAEGPLQCQNADERHFYQPRSCMRSAAGMVEMSMPTMGSPRSLEISASSL